MNFSYMSSDNVPGLGDFNSISPWGVFPFTAKQVCEEELGAIIVPDNPLNQFIFNQNGYLFTSDNSIYSGEQPLILEKLMSLEEPFFAFGQPPGHGLNDYKFVIYYADIGRVFMLSVPHGGAFMNNEASAKKINQAFQELEKFIKTPYESTEGIKKGLFFKSELRGYSPIFDVDCKTLEFRETEVKSNQ